MLRESPFSRVYCIIDGLDVYKHGMDELLGQLAIIFNPENEHDSILKLFCTSRPHPTVFSKRQLLPSRIFRPEDKDMDIAIQSRIDLLEDKFTGGMKTFLMDGLQK